jgi:hypothetical protein
VAAGLVSQGVAIFDALRGGVIDYDDDGDGAPLAGQPKDASRQRDSLVKSTVRPGGVAAGRPGAGPIGEQTKIETRAEWVSSWATD